MDENMNNQGQNPVQNEQGAVNVDPVQSEGGTRPTEGINNFNMDAGGKIYSTRGGSAAMAASSRSYIVLGWISAAFAAFVSPYFAIAGIVLGVLANRQSRGSGNTVIITNIVLAAFNIILKAAFGLFLWGWIRQMFIGY